MVQKLQRVVIGNDNYYVDLQLLQLREVNNPHDFMSFTSSILMKDYLNNKTTEKVKVFTYSEIEELENAYAQWITDTYIVEIIERKQLWYYIDRCKFDELELGVYAITIFYR